MICGTSFFFALVEKFIFREKNANSRVIYSTQKVVISTQMKERSGYYL